MLVSPNALSPSKSFKKFKGYTKPELQGKLQGIKASQTDGASANRDATLTNQSSTAGSRSSTLSLATFPGSRASRWKWAEAHGSEPPYAYLAQVELAARLADGHGERNPSEEGNALQVLEVLQPEE